MPFLASFFTPIYNNLRPIFLLKELRFCNKSYKSDRSYVRISHFIGKNGNCYIITMFRVELLLKTHTIKMNKELDS